MTDTVQLANEGIKVIVYVKDQAGAAKDLTGATNLKIKLKSAIAQTGKTKTATFEGSPTTGALTCTLTAGEIDTLATWKAQAYYELGSFKGHTRPEDIFYVEGNLA